MGGEVCKGRRKIVEVMGLFTTLMTMTAMQTYTYTHIYIYTHGTYLKCFDIYAELLYVTFIST